MTDMPLVSVIIPVYNVEKYLEFCIKTFENQKLKDFELIVVNDGSTDSSKDILLKYKNNHNLNMDIIEIQNQGVSVARNVGLSKAQGKYVCFVDSDDMVTEEYLSYLSKILEKNEDCDAVICQRRDVKDSDNAECTYVNYNNDYDVEIVDSLIVLKKLLYRKLSAGIWNVLVRRKLLIENDLKFAEGFAYSEDLEMVWKIIATSKRVALIKAKLYLYRQRNDSAMQRFDKKRFDGYELFRNLEIYMRENRKDFSVEFDKYGVAYWVWSTIWQAAKLSTNYYDFQESIEILDIKYYMKGLSSFPRKIVRGSSRIFICSSWLYYKLVKILFQLKKSL